MKKPIIFFAQAILIIVLSIAGISSAQAIQISSYDVINGRASGFGNWHWGSNALNDGMLGSSTNDTMLIYNPDTTKIILHLAQTGTIGNLVLYSFLGPNVIPGNMTGVTVTINGISDYIHLGPGSGQVGYSGQDINELVDLTSSPFNNLLTDTITLSGFTSIGNFSSYSAISEIIVNGNTDNNTPVPEPCTFLLLGAGFAGFGLMRRRIRK